MPPSDDDGGDKKRAVVATDAADEEDMCWLCLDAAHESGESLRRDCSCRGGSGWAHFPCIVEYAKQKTEEWDDKDIPDDFGKFTEQWSNCPNCKQPSQNDLSVELAREFVAFVEEKYPEDWPKILQHSM